MALEGCEVMRTRSKRVHLLWAGVLFLGLCSWPYRIVIQIQPQVTDTSVGRPATPLVVSPTFPGTLAFPSETSKPTATATVPPTATASPTVTLTPSLVHRMQPGALPAMSEKLFDAVCGPYLQPGQPVVPPRGDDYHVNLYERPMNAETQDTYFPELDIQQAQIGTDGTWIYVVLDLFGLPDDGFPANVRYGVELDLDIDGRGDWLIWVQPPLGDVWQVEGVQVYHDADDDVGEDRACRNDPPQDGTAYETRVFDAGWGEDADLAWARGRPGDPPQVHIAFKHDMIDRDPAFMWWVWADQGVNRPDWMDYNDHFTAEEAGSPFRANPNYPVKAIAEVDNTCHWVFGFKPTGKEPCICAGRFPTPTPTAAPRPGQITGRLFKDRDGDGKYDPNEGVSGWTVIARQGPCSNPGSIGATAVTNAQGAFSMEVPAGRWCVIPEREYLWSPSSQSVDVPAGGSVHVTFQYRP